MKLKSRIKLFRDTDDVIIPWVLSFEPYPDELPFKSDSGRAGIHIFPLYFVALRFQL